VQITGRKYAIERACTVLKAVSIECIVLCFICLADLVSTIFLVSYRDCEEGNPLMNYYLAHRIAVFIIAKVTLFAFPLYIIEWARRSRPVFAKMASRACILLYLFAYVSTVISLNQLTAAPNMETVYAQPPVTASMGLDK